MGIGVGLSGMESEINIKGVVSDGIDWDGLDVSGEEKKWWYSRETEW